MNINTFITAAEAFVALSKVHKIIKEKRENRIIRDKALLYLIECHRPV